MGVGRFAFTPMLPLMLRDGSLAADAGSWLAAANYLGYLAGAMTAHRLGLAPARMVALGLVGTVVSTAAMGLVENVPAWLALRAFGGALSGWTLVGASAWAMFELARLGRPHLAGVAYAGVGAGIALAGLFCLVASGPGVHSPALWRELGALSLVAAAAPLALVRGGPGLRAAAPQRAASGAGGLKVMTLCYAAFGFGYILPATFLPAMARQVIDDPRLFGLVWPAFGIATAASTLVAMTRWAQANRLRCWALCHVAMAAGALLPSLWLSPATLAAATLLIGGSFMVVTVLGMQEARARAPHQATAVIGRMTAAFAVGQLAGPLTVAFAPPGALDVALQVAAAMLAVSAAALWRLARRDSG